MSSIRPQTPEEITDLKFDTVGDRLGYGAVIVNGRYFSLPLGAVKLFDQLHTAHK